MLVGGCFCCWSTAVNSVSELVWAQVFSCVRSDLEILLCSFVWGVCACEENEMLKLFSGQAEFLFPFNTSQAMELGSSNTAALWAWESETHQSGCIVET